MREEKLNRRDFLNVAKSTLVGAGATVSMGSLAAVFGPLAWDAAQNKWNKEELLGRIESCRQELEKRYGVKVGLSFEDFKPVDDIQGGKLFAAQIQSLYVRCKGIEGLKYLLALYPPELVTSFVKEIRLTDGLNMKRREEDVGRSVGGTVDYEKKILITNIQDVFKTLQAMFNAVVPATKVHHELAHLFTQHIPADEWRALHPGGSYLGELSMLLGERGKVPQGFVNRHSLSNEAEDQATIVEIMFSREDVYAKYKEDPIISRKITYLEKWYEKISKGRINAQYWIDVRRGDIQEGYWDRR